MQCRLKKSESHSKITANRRHIKAAAPFFLRQPSVARCPSAVRPHAVRSPPFVCRPGPRPLPPTAHTTKKEPRRRLPGVRIKVLRYNRNLSVYQNIKRNFKAWLPPCPPAFCAALHRVCIFLSDNAKVVKIPEFSKCGKFCGSSLYFALSVRPIVPVIGSARLKNRASDGGSRTFACIAFSAPSKGTNVPAIHRLKAGRTGTVRFLS